MRAIFISYRREDAEGQAGRLFADLVKHFGDQAVFMDVANIEPGRDFRKAIDEHVGTCGVLLSLIGSQWLDAKDAQGKRRLDDENDFVRLETASALKRDIPVVPVLVHGARMPRKEDLPANLQDLAFRNAIELTHARWDSDLTVLIKALSRLITPENAPAPEPARAASSAPPAPSPSSKSSKTKFLAVGGGLLALILAGYFVFRTPPGNVPLDPPVADSTSGPGDESPVTPSPDTPAPTPAETPEDDERNTLFGVADWDRDGHQDFISRQNTTGDLFFYPGDSKRGLRRKVRILMESGWAGYTPFGIVDWDGDGHEDILTRNDQSGQLMLYPGQSTRAPSTESEVEIGAGWNGRTFFGACDWDGDGDQDILARNDASGELMLYPGEGVRRKSKIKPVSIGEGWTGYTFVGVADWDGDGHQDILTRNDANDDLLLYPGESVRRMSSVDGSRIGNGWGEYSFFGVADWDRDGHPDILTRQDSTGDLVLYPGEGTREMSRIAPVKIAVGFDQRN